MATHNVRISTLIYGGVPIPLGGESVFAEAVVEERYAVADGMAGKIFSKIPIVGCEITISCYAEDPCNAILRGLVTADDAALGLVPSPGVMTDSAGQALGWAEAKIVQAAAMGLERDSSIRTWRIRTGRCTVTQIPTPATVSA